MARVSVIGTGYVGLTTGTCFAQMGHTVACVDIDENKIARLQAGDIPIYEPGMEDLVRSNMAAGRLRFTADYMDGLSEAEFVFIAVGTPTSPDGRAADLRYVYAAARTIAKCLPARAVIVNKSTSPIGTADTIVRVMDSERPEFAPWSVVSNPEFLREGQAIHDCLHPSRVVLGAADETAADAVATLYDTLDCPVIKTDLHTAEMIKYASNAFLATRISFINEVARICDALDADVCTVAEGMGLDPRIGPAFLNAGLGYGGSCFPKDVAALTHMAACAGLHPQLLRTVSEINVDQRRWAVSTLRDSLGELEGRTIAVWGLTFKPDTDDLREAPALEIAQRLLDEGAHVRAYDPVIHKTLGERDLPGTICSNPYDAVRGADALLLATDWKEFESVSWSAVSSLMSGDVVFDGRNCLDPAEVAAAGLRYIGVGRPTATADTACEAISA